MWETNTEQCQKKRNLCLIHLLLVSAAVQVIILRRCLSVDTGPHIPKWTLQRHLQENNRKSTTHTDF